eukprot:TRINITY_DN2004_c0_g1_i5.p12 TRINITY_DN2004_c0_g1~~TRINITY_DN2004_c0_g1_i5.p12  ORF type:complete len:182 (-),score=18.73 TRINITY_DN2004_c0_g1_i5:7777-8322(-)
MSWNKQQDQLRERVAPLQNVIAYYRRAPVRLLVSAINTKIVSVFRFYLTSTHFHDGFLKEMDEIHARIVVRYCEGVEQWVGFETAFLPTSFGGYGVQSLYSLAQASSALWLVLPLSPTFDSSQPSTGRHASSRSPLTLASPTCGSTRVHSPLPEAESPSTMPLPSPKLAHSREPNLWHPGE